MPAADTIAVNVPEDLTAEEWRGFLGTCGLALVAYAKERFQPQNNDWTPTMWPRIAELLEDMKRGAVRERTLTQEHQTGVGTGRLRDSIHAILPAPNADISEAEIALVIGGGGVDYAERFHFGGHGSIEIPQQQLRAFYGTPRGKEFIKRHGLGWLFRRAFFEFDQPARPIVEMDAIKDIIEAEARERWPEYNGGDAWP